MPSMPSKALREAAREQRERLGAVVLNWRRDNGMTQGDVRDAGGPSTTKLTEIENATGPSPRASTLKSLDRGLGWVLGSAWGVLYDDLPPTPLTADERPSRPTVEPDALRRVEEIRRHLDAIERQIREGILCE